MTWFEKRQSWRSAEGLSQDKWQMFARLGSPEFSADPVLRAKASLNTHHAAPDASSTRLESVHKQTRDISLTGFHLILPGLSWSRNQAGTAACAKLLVADG